MKTHQQQENNEISRRKEVSRIIKNNKGRVKSSLDNIFGIDRMKNQ
jgi:hypothetical protein